MDNTEHQQPQHQQLTANTTNLPDIQQRAQQQKQQQKQVILKDEMMDIKKSKPYVKILEQPASKALRFRYECEGRSAGSIPGVNSTPENKTYPTIEIVGYKGRAVVVVSCVTKDFPYRPHPHNLVGKDGCKKGVCTMEINSETMRAVFSNLGIQCVKKKDIEMALKAREEIRVDPFKTGFAHRFQPSSIDLNSVRLCFQVFTECEQKGRFTQPLPPVVTEPIYDKKAMSDLVICRLSSCTSSVLGNNQIILLCEKVAKDDIQVRFFEEKYGQVVWEAYGDFQQCDVHKQAAITFKTPRYHSIDINDPVKVFIQLKRPSDGVTSEPLPFEYVPLDSDAVHLKRKRLKTSDDNSCIINHHKNQEPQRNIHINARCTDYCSTWNESSTQFTKRTAKENVLTQWNPVELNKLKTETPAFSSQPQVPLQSFGIKQQRLSPHDFLPSPQSLSPDGYHNPGISPTYNMEYISKPLHQQQQQQQHCTIKSIPNVQVGGQYLATNINLHEYNSTQCGINNSNHDNCATNQQSLTSNKANFNVNGPHGIPNVLTPFTRNESVGSNLSYPLNWNLPQAISVAAPCNQLEANIGQQTVNDGRANENIDMNNSCSQNEHGLTNLLNIDSAELVRIDSKDQENLHLNTEDLQISNLSISS